MLKLLFLVLLKVQPLELEATDLNNFIEIAKAPSISQIFKKMSAAYPELRIIVVGKNPQWHDTRVSDIEVRFFKSMNDEPVMYYPAFLSTAPLVIREHPRIVIHSGADKAAVLYLFLNYLVDRILVSEVPKDQAISYIDFLEQEFEARRENEPDQLKKIIITTEEAHQLFELYYLSKVKIGLFMSENSHQLKISEDQVTYHLRLAATQIKLFEKRLDKHLEQIKKFFTVNSKIIAMTIAANLKAQKLEKRIEAEYARHTCAIKLKN